MKRLFLRIITSVLTAGASTYALAQASTPTVSLARIVVTMPAGERFGQLQRGIGKACMTYDRVDWRGDRDLETEEFQTPFIRAMADAGFKPPASATNLFAETSSQSD